MNGQGGEVEDRGLEWVEQGSLEQDSIIHLSWLETALWAPLTPVLCPMFLPLSHRVALSLLP